jgi:hypothetical protein
MFIPRQSIQWPVKRRVDKSKKRLNTTALILTGDAPDSLAAGRPCILMHLLSDNEPLLPSQRPDGRSPRLASLGLLRCKLTTPA